MEITILLTNSCNLRCKHCFRDKSQLETPLEAIIKTIEDVQRLYGSPYIKLTGGEPTLHSQFEEILRILYNKGLAYHFVTNGWNFEEKISIILKYKEYLRWIYFSLDGADKETNDTIRGEGTFGRTIRAIKECSRWGIGCGILCSVSQNNLDQIEEIANLSIKNGVKRVYFTPVFWTPFLVKNALILDDFEKFLLLRKVDRMNKNVDISPSCYMGNSIRNVSPVLNCRSKNLDEITLDSEGNICICCDLSKYIGGSDSKDIIGPILEEDLLVLLQRHKDIWSEYLKSKRKDFEKGMLKGEDTFPCHHCSKYFGKMDWLGEVIDGDI